MPPAQVAEEATKALAWLEERQAAQAALRKTDPPLLLADDIKKKADVLTRFAEPLVSRPAPPPPVRRCSRSYVSLSIEKA